MDLESTRASELPAEMAATLGRIAEAAERFAANEARVCVRTLLVTLNVGAFEHARRCLDGYAQRVGFIGEPTADLQKTLRVDIALAYARMSPETQRRFDDLLSDVRRNHPKAWIGHPVAR
jgi:hypothetical protein